MEWRPVEQRWSLCRGQFIAARSLSRTRCIVAISTSSVYSDSVLNRLISSGSSSALGGHLKTGHRSTVQNRPSLAWRPRPFVVDRHLILWSCSFSVSTTSIGCVNVGISRSVRDSQSPVETVCGFHGAVICIAIFGIVVLLRGLVGAQVGLDLGAPAPRSALENVRVMEQPIEERGDGGRVAEQLPPVVHRSV